jgi:type II secretory pathway component PulF
MSDEPVERSPREKWSPPLAAAIVASHMFAGMVVFFWHYMIVPRWKYELEGFGLQLSSGATLLITQSDFIITFWYMLVPVALVALVVDFFIARWLGRQAGLRAAALYGLLLFALPIIQVAYGEFALRSARLQILNLISTQGPMPGARQNL